MRKALHASDGHQGRVLVFVRLCLRCAGGGRRGQACSHGAVVEPLQNVIGERDTSLRVPEVACGHKILHKCGQVECAGALGASLVREHVCRVGQRFQRDGVARAWRKRIRTARALFAAAAADTWMWTPFIILLATAAFRGIPDTIYEAAEVDGASPAYVFFRITLPMSAPVLFIALILRLIDSFKQYDLFFALTGGGPGST